LSHHNNPKSLLYNNTIIIPRNRGLYYVSNNAKGIKIGLQLYYLWQTHVHQLNWRIANQKTPTWVSSSISRKRQATGFEPLRHKLSDMFSFLFSWMYSVFWQKMLLV